MTRILCVCLGNICRSPTAEAVLRSLADARGMQVGVDSAGTSDWHIGNPPYGPAIEAAVRRGYDLATLRARQFTAGDFHAFDLILAMDGSNLAEIERLRPSSAAAEARLFLVGSDVPDPYYTHDYDGALDLIEAGAARILDQLQNASATSPKLR